MAQCYLLEQPSKLMIEVKCFKIENFYSSEIRPQIIISLHHFLDSKKFHVVINCEDFIKEGTENVLIDRPVLF